MWVIKSFEWCILNRGVSFNRKSITDSLFNYHDVIVAGRASTTTHVEYKLSTLFITVCRFTRGLIILEQVGQSVLTIT